MCRVPGNPGYYIEFEVQEGVESQVVCALEGLLWDPMQDTWGWVTASSGIASTLAGTILLVSYALDVQTAAQSNQILVTNKDWLGGVLLGVGVVLGASSYFVFMRNEPEATPAEETPQSSLWVLPLPEGGALFQGSLRF
jgi:hypothetical protein